VTYTETLDFLFSQLPMFQRVGQSAYKANLDTTLALDNHFKHPHTKFLSIHVAGTNGKGSVSHMLASVLMEAGYKVGLYTSPHLIDFRERIKINGELIPEESVIQFVEQNLELIEDLKPSFFEMTVALAFEYFALQQIDIAVVETGMGGRLDSTNIVTPLISVITNIDYDHTQFLGNTLELIAAEKAGIIKANIPVIIGKTQKETESVFIGKAKKMYSSIYFADKTFSVDYSFKTLDAKQSFNINRVGELIYRDLQLDLLGIYQKENILTVLQTLEVINDQKLLTQTISQEIIYCAMANAAKSTGLIGRWQIVGSNPLIVCDTGHNEAGIRNIVEQIAMTPFQNLHIVLGMVNDKEISKVLQLLPLKAKYYFTKASIPRALDENELLRQAENQGLLGKSYQTVKQAITAARENAGEKDFIFIGGSTFIVADALPMFI